MTDNGFSRFPHRFDSIEKIIFLLFIYSMHRKRLFEQTAINGRTDKCHPIGTERNRVKLIKNNNKINACERARVALLRLFVETEDTKQTVNLIK